MKKIELNDINGFDKYFERELKNLYNAQITKSYLIKFENGTTLNIAIEHE